MMKMLSKTVLAVALLGTASACGDSAPSGNAVEISNEANVQSDSDYFLLNDSAAPAAVANDSVPAAAPAETRKPAPRPEPKAKAPAKPKATKAPPPVNDDPHAGHDMANMAHNQQ
jgi:hypothetical protein